MKSHSSKEMYHRKYEYAFDSRVSRALSQRIYLIDSTAPPEGSGEDFHFSIMGNSGIAYDIRIGTKFISCSCPDHSANGNLCKHLLFVLIRLLKYTHNDVFKNYYMPLVYEDLKNNHFETQDDTLKRCAFYLENREKLSKQNKKKLEGADCPICLEELKDPASGPVVGKAGGEPLLWCKAQCGNFVHQNCFLKWVEKKDGANCVLCRAQWVW
jgi:hypothetical protein